MSQKLKLISSILFFVTAGLLSGLLAVNAGTYYTSLNLPSFAPPGWVFGPVWFLLYILMGVTFYKISLWKDTTLRLRVQMVFLAQFILNILWSALFFMLKITSLAFFDIVLLLALLIAITLILAIADKKTMWYNLPYTVWVAFATILNGAILILN